MKINSFSIATDHFVVNGEDGAVMILVNGDYRTGAENGLIGPITNQREFVEAVKALREELETLMDSVVYPGLHKSRVWDMLPEKPAVEIEADGGEQNVA